MPGAAQGPGSSWLSWPPRASELTVSCWRGFGCAPPSARVLLQSPALPASAHALRYILLLKCPQGEVRTPGTSAAPGDAMVGEALLFPGMGAAPVLLRHGWEAKNPAPSRSLPLLSSGIRGAGRNSGTGLCVRRGCAAALCRGTVPGSPRAERMGGTGAGGG